MLVCDEHKWIFLRNPKTATRSVTVALKNNFFTRKVGNYHSWEIPKKLSEYFIFSTVRNPYERAISGWQHWVGNGKNLTFEEFFDAQKDWADLKMSGFMMKKSEGRYWKIQSNTLNKIKGEVHILRYENLEEDLNSLPFIDNIVLPRIGVQNYGDWKSHYTPDLEAKVYELLQKDFERFGYKRVNFNKEQISLL